MLLFFQASAATDSVLPLLLPADGAADTPTTVVVEGDEPAEFLAALAELDATSSSSADAAYVTSDYLKSGSAADARLWTLSTVTGDAKVIEHVMVRCPVSDIAEV